MRVWGPAFLTIVAACATEATRTSSAPDGGLADGGGPSTSNTSASQGCSSASDDGIATVDAKSGDVCALLATGTTVDQAKAAGSVLWTAPGCSSLCGADGGPSWYCEVPTYFVSAFQNEGAQPADASSLKCPSFEDAGDGGADEHVSIRCWTLAAADGWSPCSF
jgi:hypothetical protein